ncbi:DUF255 domain-containing protein [cf. Phormidesmis sp. LEGE 11477]|uniref:DUF255 domain-containing protein n=1 Tax=cf. Phormidesmis sp. LEGE 11477 TaxID=1828680 RepID=UPI00351CD0CC
MTNRLANSSSLYLRKHAENPVDRWPWCEEALTTAQRENRPIFLSIGGSSCHWCTVMEGEAFFDEAIALVCQGLKCLSAATSKAVLDQQLDDSQF